MVLQLDEPLRGEPWKLHGIASPKDISALLTWTGETCYLVDMERMRKLRMTVT